MGAWLSTEERDELERRLAAAREEWVGVELDYGPYTRTVFDCEIDDRGRLILCARSDDEDGYCPELASEWDD
jgi:hypothetical protein